MARKTDFQNSKLDWAALFSMLANCLPQRVFLKDRESTYIACNRMYAVDLGISAEQIPGKTDFDFYPKELAEKYRTDDQRVMEAGKPEDIEESYISGGMEFFIHTAKRPLRDQNGAVVGLLGVILDVTDLKMNIKALKYEQDKMNAVFNSIEELIYVADPDTYDLLFVNDAFKKIWGDDVVGKKCYKVLYDIDSPCENCTNNLIFGENTGKPYIREYEYTSGDMKKWLRCFEKAIPWSDGKLVRFELGTDITNLKNIEEELNRHRSHLEELVRDRTAALEWEIQEGKRREQVIAQQTQEILDLSTPVLKIFQGILVAPLIGSIDSLRTQQFMDTFLGKIAETNAQIALVDITGVPTIDTQTGQHLIEAITAARLLGAEVVLTGVRPAIAQTLVHLGIDLSDFETCASLAAGLERALEMVDMTLVSRDGYSGKEDANAR